MISQSSCRDMMKESASMSLPVGRVACFCDHGRYSGARQNTTAEGIGHATCIFTECIGWHPRALKTPEKSKLIQDWSQKFDRTFSDGPAAGLASDEGGVLRSADALAIG